MHKKLNCWEIQDCPRADTGHDNPCPVIFSSNSDGINKGENGGRYCWRIAGTFCNGKSQGNFAQKVDDCTECPVFSRILREEGPSFQL